MILLARAGASSAINSFDDRILQKYAPLVVASVSSTDKMVGTYNDPPQVQMQVLKVLDQSVPDKITVEWGPPPPSFDVSMPKHVLEEMKKLKLPSPDVGSKWIMMVQKRNESNPELYRSNANWRRPYSPDEVERLKNLIANRDKKTKPK